MTRAKRKLIKFSNYSFCITLPKKAIDELGWKKGEEVSVNFDNRTKRIHIFRSTYRLNNNKNNKTSSTKKKTKRNNKVKPIPRLRW